MANLVKIDKVHLYVGLHTPEGAADSVHAKKLFDDAGISYTLLHYGTDAQGTFDALNTWSFGPDYKQYTFTDFPFAHWTEYFDDYERFNQVAFGLESLKTCHPIVNPTAVASNQAE
jgi:hypothetical protein